MCELYLGHVTSLDNSPAVLVPCINIEIVDLPTKSFLFFRFMADHNLSSHYIITKQNCKEVGHNICSTLYCIPGTLTLTLTLQRLLQLNSYLDIEVTITLPLSLCKSLALRCVIHYTLHFVVTLSLRNTLALRRFKRVHAL